MVQKTQNDAFKLQKLVQTKVVGDFQNCSRREFGTRARQGSAKRARSSTDEDDFQNVPEVARGPDDRFKTTNWRETTRQDKRG